MTKELDMLMSLLTKKILIITEDNNGHEGRLDKVISFTNNSDIYIQWVKLSEYKCRWVSEDAEATALIKYHDIKQIIILK